MWKGFFIEFRFYSLLADLCSWSALIWGFVRGGEVLGRREGDRELEKFLEMLVEKLKEKKGIDDFRRRGG